ncbi:MFS transporter [Mycolicibacterium stellerae]|uniref:MFS transporter n=1 Tax=Mycolicibacterium stellerae TaxID=2358193 RepID=UPI0019D1D0AB|nr:MFS transporter [Mycolicibacterium stellerae]
MGDELKSRESEHGGEDRWRARMARRAAVGSFLGSVVEYYDFLIYGTASALVFNKVFFPAVNPTAGMLAALATFGVGYIARPVGAILFGHLGDRRGRKAVLTTTLLLMGFATVGIGLLPTYATIGTAAPALLMVLRLLQGLSAGGEQVGASLLTMEHAPPKKRGLYVSWMLNGASSGSILGTMVFIPISALPESALLSWGWRLPFLVSAVTVVIAFLVRRGITESPEFVARVAEGGGASRRFPLIDLLRSHSVPTVLVLLASLVTCVSPLVLVFGLSYGSTNPALDRTSILTAITASQFVALVCHPLFGALADRVGKKRVFVAGSLACAVVTFPFVGALAGTSTTAVLVMTVLLKGIVYAAPNSLWPSFFAERFPPAVRYSGVAIATQIGFILQGFTPTVAFAVAGQGSYGWLPAAAFVAAVCVIAAAAAAMSRRADEASPPEPTLDAVSTPSRTSGG